jgi:hypothetical protein
LNYRNNLILLVKNYGLLRLAARLPVRILLDIINILYFIVNMPGQMRFLSVFWAYLEFAAMLPALLRPGRGPSAFSADTDAWIYPSYPVSVVWQYFIMGRKKFSQLKLKGRG